MKKTILFFILTVTMLTKGLSQPCLPDGITFSSQYEIDNFKTNYPNCTEIGGDVQIEGWSITNLNGLNALTSIWGSMYIFANKNLTNMAGLENLDSIGGWLYFDFNDSLINTVGMENLASIGGSFIFQRNAATVSLKGLDNLKIIGGKLWIRGNNTLSSLEGLGNVNSIGGSIEISYNDLLLDLTHLTNVKNLGGYLLIDNNTSLKSLFGLDNIDAESIEKLYIFDNSSLCFCAVKSICDFIVDTTNNLDIYNNGLGCNNKIEIRDDCETFGIFDIESINVFSIYPNPAKVEIFISNITEQKINGLNIYNQLGEMVLHTTELKHAIDISMLKQGLYIVESISDNLRTRQKLVIQN